MITINATLVLQVIHFLILVFVLNLLLFRPIMKLVTEREQHILKTKTSVRDMEDKVFQLKEEITAKLQEARIRATDERLKIREEGFEEASALFDEEQKEVTAIRTQADTEAAQEFEKVRPHIGKEAEQLADVILEKLIRRRIAA